MNDAQARAIMLRLTQLQARVRELEDRLAMAYDCYEAAMKDFQIERTNADHQNRIIESLQARPGIEPCECGHRWDEHGWSGERGGCHECDCSLIVSTIKVGQGYSGTMTF